MPHRTERILLCVLFAVICAIQVRWSITTLDYVLDATNVAELALDIDPTNLQIVTAREYSEKAGIHKGDTLVAVNGQAIKNFMQARRTLVLLRPGTIATVETRHEKAKPAQKSFQVRSRHMDGVMDVVVPVTLNIITPWFGLLLGFLVAFRRTGDPVANAFLALLICLSQLLKAEGALRNTWEPIFVWPAYFIDVLANSALPVAWLWFTSVFPDPHSPHRLWPKVSLALGLPFVILGFWQAVTTVAVLHDPSTSSWSSPLSDLPSPTVTVWIAVMYSLGFANLVHKLHRETQPSTRRRLKWIAFGLSIGLAPILLLLLAANILHLDLNSLSWWILTPSILSPFFVPLTLAYAVLVDRVFDVGVFVRQGLLASKTVLIVRFILIFGLIAALVQVVIAAGLTKAQHWEGALGCLAGIFLVSWGSERLRRWVDRRFFQEAINTEHLLLELSDEVRRIADPQALLAVVTERLASALHVLRVVALVPEAGGFVPAYASGFNGHMPQTKIAHTNTLLTRLREARQPLTLSVADRVEITPLGAELLLPLSTNGELHGILSLGPKRSDEPYSGRDLRLLESVASQTALAMENGRLTAVVAAEAAHRERLNSELEIARDVQRRLFPKHAPKPPGLELAGHCQPAQTIGGDYYDFLTTPSGDTGLAIGDVAGKGIPAALLMAGLQASLRALTLAGISDLADLMARLNLLVYDATPANRFATFFYGIYSPNSKRLCYSSAGHNAVLLYRTRTGELIWLKTRGVGLGLGRYSQYEQADVMLQPGDYLVLYTDGVTEARNEQDEEFGEERLAAEVRACSQMSAAQMLQSLMEATSRFAGSAPQHDDITMIVGRAL